jgi:hypothetical protein
MISDKPETLVHPDSLGDTIDAINAALFEQLALPQPVCAEAAAWLADRQGLPGSYAGMFAPTGYDYAFGTLTFTGEPVRSGAATGHVLSEEACRALFRLGGCAPQAAPKGQAGKKGAPVNLAATNGQSAAVNHAATNGQAAPVGLAAPVNVALDRARQAIFKRIEQSEAPGKSASVGVYCCGTCSVALWRHLTASGIAGDQQRLENGLAELHRYRDGEGRWKRFPFYYTLLALSEMDIPGVREEIVYAGNVIERALRRLNKADPEMQSLHDGRRKIVLERVLEMC